MKAQAAVLKSLPDAGARVDAQAAKPSPNQLTLMSLYVTVQDKKGHAVTSLGREEFRIFEDGQPQSIELYEARTEVPLTVALLLDTSGSRSQQFPGAEREAALLFFRNVLKSKDVGMVVGFSQEGELFNDLTNDASELERSINRVLQRVPVGDTAIFDTIYAVCDQRLYGPAGRKVIVILTDGEDNASRIKLDEAIGVAQRNNVTIHVIRYAQPQGPPLAQKKPDGRRVAQGLAEETGGVLVSVKKAEDFLQAFGRISEALRSQYTLGYYPANPARDGKFRKLKVETTRKDTKVLTRKGYYATKERLFP